MIEDILEIVKQAGEIALDYQNHLKEDTKADDSLVTNGDIAVSKFLEEKLSKYYPVLSEENYNKELIKNQPIFVIDPIDGTISYSKKEESWSILVALVDKEEPILGVVYQPTTGKIYYAQKDKGAFLDYNKQIKSLKVNEDTKMAIVSPREKNKERQQVILKELEIENVKEYYGAGIKMVKIAEAEVDVYASVSHKCSVWDLYAGWIILREAGGELNLPVGYKINLKKPLVDVDFIAANKIVNFNF